MWDGNQSNTVSNILFPSSSMVLLPQTRSSIPRSSCRHRPHPPCSFLRRLPHGLGGCRRLHASPPLSPALPPHRACSSSSRPMVIPKAELMLIRQAANLPQGDPKLSLMPSSMSCQSSQPRARIAMLRPCCSLLLWWPPEPPPPASSSMATQASPPAPTRHGCTSPHSGEETWKRRGRQETPFKWVESIPSFQRMDRTQT